MDLRHAVASPDERKLLQGIIHILSHLLTAVDGRLATSLGQRVSQSDLLYHTVKVHVEAMFKPHLWIIQHGELSVILFLSLICLIKLLHSFTFASKSLNHEHAKL